MLSSKQIFGIRLKEIREQNNLSLKQLADLLSLKSKGSISAFEAGRTAPSVDVLMKAAELFHVSTDYLLGFDGGLLSKAELSGSSIIQENKQLKTKISELEKQLSKIHKISEKLLEVAEQGACNKI